MVTKTLIDPDGYGLCKYLGICDMCKLTLYIDRWGLPSYDICIYKKQNLNGEYRKCKNINLRKKNG